MQTVIWPGTLVGADKTKEFIEWMSENTNTKVNYLFEFTTLPGNGGDGGRNDLVFRIPNEDVPKFVLTKLAYGMRWLGDYLQSDSNIVPVSVLTKLQQLNNQDENHSE